MARENAATKATRYLTEGRLIVTAVDRLEVHATCRGDGHLWHQHYRAGLWTCTCPARTDQCAHLRALRTVTAVDLEDRR